MKPSLLLLLIATLFCQVQAQYQKRERTTKTIIQQRSIYLNGGLKASMNGKSRVVIPFDLPPNTKEWYYSFSTAKGESGVKLLNLGIQLGVMALDPTGAASSITSQIKVPPGSNSVDIYLLTAENQTAFVEKWDNEGGRFYYISEGTTQNTQQAVIRVDDITTGRLFLGLKNPSTLSGVHIYIEVTAIVEQNVYVDEWTTESRNNFKSNCLQKFYTEVSGKNEVCDCLVDEIMSQNSPSQWNQQSTTTQQTIEDSELNNCFNKTDNIALKNAELEYREQLRLEREAYNKSVNEVRQVLSEASAAVTLGSYREARDQTLIAIDLVLRNEKIQKTYNPVWISNSYNSAAWYSILLNEIDIAGQHLKKSFSYNSQNMYARGNLGLFHLLKGNYSEAEKTFFHYKRREKFPDKRKWVDVIAEDLNILEQKGMGNADFDKIRKVLKIRIKK